VPALVRATLLAWMKADSQTTGEVLHVAWPAATGRHAPAQAVLPAYARVHAAVWRAGAGGALALQQRTHCFRDGERVVRALPLLARPGLLSIKADASGPGTSGNLIVKVTRGVHVCCW